MPPSKPTRKKLRITAEGLQRPARPVDQRRAMTVGEVKLDRRGSLRK